MVLGVIFSLNSQDSSKAPNWEDMILRPEYNFHDVQKAFYDRWRNMNYIKDDGYKLFKRWEYSMEQIVDSDGNFDKNKIEREYLKYKDRISSGFYRELSGDWEQMGPFGFISEYGIGRVNVVTFNPNNNQELWLGSPSGGLWKSVNGGETWTPFSNDFRMMGISDIVIDPKNTDIMYVATGDRDAGDTWSYGVLKSTDGGNTWASTNLPSVDRITRILQNQENTNELLVATDNGVYKTVDGGESWTSTLDGHFIKYMEYKPNDSKVIYATDYSYYSVSPVCYRSDDGGKSFSPIKVDGMSSDVSVIAIGTCQSHPEIVYLLAGINKSGWSAQDFEGIYKSEDSGLSFTKINSTFYPELGSQSWYDWTFAVAPDNPNELYAGGVGYFKSIDGGRNWNEINNWTNPNNNHSFHVDQHHSVFQPNTNTFFVGNDGGLYKSDNRGKYWTGLNEELSITQYYRVGTSSKIENMVVCGAQDNGTHLLDGSKWSRILGGDGMDCTIDRYNPNIIFASYQFGEFAKSTNRGQNFNYMLTPNDVGEEGAWVTPFVQDPQNRNVLYIGYNSLWKSKNHGNDWENISGKISGANTIRRIEVSKSNTDYIYISFKNSIYSTQDGGRSWNTISNPFGEDGSINDIVVSPRNPKKIWAVGVPYGIYKSENGGESWDNISGTIPNVPLTSVVVQNNDKESVYLGTYIGVFYSDNTLEDWVPFNKGLPPVRIGELEITPEFKKLRAGTYGRGLWESHLRDFDANLPLCSDITEPSNGSVIPNGTVVLKWKKIDNATGYKISIGDSWGEDNILQTKDLGDTISYKWNTEGINQKIFVNITAYNEYGETQSCNANYYKVGCYYEDRKALLSFYNSMNGDSWNNSWDTTKCDLSKWYGITTDLNGNVVSIDLDGAWDDNASTSYGNNLSGDLDLESLSKLKELKRLFLSGNKISYNIFDNIENLHILEELDLSKNGIKGEFPIQVTKLSNLKYLNLSLNNISGEIPSDISELKKLETLILSNNKISGNIPKSITYLPSCKKINLSKNELTGKLHSQIWYLKNLKYLNVSHNKLTGIISNQIKSAKKLNYLYINNNSFTGKIPKGLTEPNLHDLYANDNNFHGCFSNELKDLCSLLNIDFSNNPQLPENGNFDKFCKDNIGNCDYVPTCSNGLISEISDSIYHNVPIKWEKVENAEGYKLSIGTKSGSYDILKDFDVKGSNTYQHLGLPINTELYINILPYNKYGHAYKCKEFKTHTTIRTSSIEQEDEELSEFLSIYPMPATDFLTITKNKTELGNIKFGIVDMNGRKLLSNNLKAGNNTKTISLKGFSEGIYFVKFTINRKDYYKKLIIQ